MRLNDPFAGIGQSLQAYAGTPNNNPNGFVGIPQNPFMSQQRTNPWDNFAQEVIQRFNENAGRIIAGPIDAVAQSGATVPPSTPITIPANASTARGQNYEVTMGRLDDRPVMVFRGQSGDVRVVPLERFIDIMRWFAPSGITPSMQQQQSAQQSPQQQQQQQQQRQQPMNLFEYMNKLPPQERMVFTVLLYLLISETLGRIFQRGGGRPPQVPAYMQSPWMPGSPKGQQWMIWG